jgi:serine/threonine-protein kinase
MVPNSPGAASLDGDARTLVKPHPALAHTELSEGPATPAGRPGTVAAPSSHPPEVDPAPAPLHEARFEDRYEDRALLGEGGMGEVRLCKDQRIGRDIAMKVVRAGVGSRSDARARFEREARVQGQLEHPSVVPVYDLGVRPDGSAFFTMKRVRGETLEQIVERLRAGEAEAEATHTRRRLLGAFSGLCLAMAFAHSRRVLHRDLKPGNIMLGAYGELYILDWGLAKLLGEAEAEAAPASTEEAPVEAPMSQRHRTAVGSMMGTPGYMSPEQIRGEIDDLDERTDVFALGAILFELLTLEPLFGRPGDPTQAVLAATLRGADARASVRAPARGVPVELDALCVHATAPAAADRLGSARELHEALERFLDGDRDLEQRRAMAERHAARAAALLAEGAREDALREASSALALEPTHPAALGLMVRLLVDAPGELPPEARAQLEEHHRAPASSRRGPAIGYAVSMAFGPMVLLLGVRSYPLLGVVSVLAVLASAVAWWGSHQARFEGVPQRLVFAVSTLFIASLGLFMGPHIIVPGMIGANTIAFVLFGQRRDRPLYLGLGVLALAAPTLLDLSGLVPPSYLFSPEGMTVLPHMSAFPRVPTQVFLLLADVLLVVMPSLLIGRVRDALTRNEERLFAYTWRLQQLLPIEARGVAAPAATVEPEVCRHLLMERLRLGPLFERRVAP